MPLQHAVKKRLLKFNTQFYVYRHEKLSRKLENYDLFVVKYKGKL